jgi:hypothetical protein
MERRQKWQTPARIYHNNGVSELMEKERWCIQVALSSVESCSSNEFSQFFVAHSCAGSAKWARSIAETRKYAYSLQTTPSRVPISSRTPPTFLSKLEPPLVPPLAKPCSRSRALSAVRNGQSRNSSPWDIRFFHLTCHQQRPPCSLLPQSSQHLPHCGAPCTDTAGCLLHVQAGQTLRSSYSVVENRRSLVAV